MPSDELGVVVTLRELHTDIKALHTDVTKCIAHIEATTKTQADHEARIRELEKSAVSPEDVEKHEERLDGIDRKVWKLSGAAAVIALLFPNISDLIDFLSR